MKKLLSFLSLILLLGVNVSFAEPVDVIRASLIATNFYSQKSETLHKSAISMGLAYECIEEISGGHKSNGITCFYVFNSSDSNGFVIVSGDDKITPVLGYSFNGNFDQANLPPNFREWLDFYKSEILYAIENTNTSASIAQQWTMLEANQSLPKQKATDAVSPLLTTRWDQDYPYNASCPYDSYYSARTVTGCVATAMAQIMKYWNYPAQGIGYKSYTHPRFGLLSANFATTTYNWSSMTNSPSSSNSAIATLMFHCGVSVEMDYAVDGSGAYSLGLSYPSAELAFKTNFGYVGAIGKDRGNYTATTWMNLIKTELDASRPIYYAGTSSDGGGHAFVCDGYDNSNYFHMNWGWSGYYDGYFLLTALNPGGVGTGGGSGGYNFSHRVIIGIQPPIEGSALSLYSELTVNQPNNIFTKGKITANYSAINLKATPYTGYVGAILCNTATGEVIFEIQKFTVSDFKQNYYFDPQNFTNANLNVPAGTYYLAAVSKRNLSDNWDIIASSEHGNNPITITVKASQVGVFESNNTNDDKIKVYPNPVADYFVLELEDEQYTASEMQIFDISGKLVGEFTIHEKSTRINMQEYVPGIYFVQLVNNQTVIKRCKIVKQ